GPAAGRLPAPAGATKDRPAVRARYRRGRRPVPRHLLPRHKARARGGGPPGALRWRRGATHALTGVRHVNAQAIVPRPKQKPAGWRAFALNRMASLRRRRLLHQAKAAWHHAIRGFQNTPRTSKPRALTPNT